MRVRAAAEPDALVIGIDAAASAMAESSRRASRDGTTNAVFLAAGAESLSCVPWLAGSVDRVTVSFPWGSLLRGTLGLDDGEVLRGVGAVLRAGGAVEVLASVVPSDRVEGMDVLDATAEPAIRDAWAAAGLELLAMCPAMRDDVVASRSSWARRLGAGHADRPVWRLAGVRPR